MFSTSKYANNLITPKGGGNKAHKSLNMSILKLKTSSKNIERETKQLH